MVGDTLGNTAILLGILGQTGFGSHKILDGKGIGLLSGGTGIVELQFLVVFANDGHTAKALTQSEIGPTQEELRLSHGIILLRKVFPLDEIGTMQSQVGIRGQLVQFVPERIEFAGI